MDFFRLHRDTGWNFSNQDKWKELWWSYKLSLKVNFLIALIIGVAIYLKISDFSSLENNNTFFDGENNSFVYNLADLCVAAIIEEVIFRLHIDFKRNHILVSLLASLLFIFFFFKFNFIWILVIGNLLILYLSSFYKSYSLSQKSQFLGIYILVNSFIFALAHTEDFSSINKNNCIVFILVLLNRMFDGILFCRIRLKNHGLEWSVLLHILVNSLPFLISLSRTFIKK